MKIKEIMFFGLISLILLFSIFLKSNSSQPTVVPTSTPQVSSRSNEVPENMQFAKNTLLYDSERLIRLMAEYKNQDSEKLLIYDPLVIGFWGIEFSRYGRQGEGQIIRSNWREKDGEWKKSVMPVSLEDSKIREKSFDVTDFDFSKVRYISERAEKIVATNYPEMTNLVIVRLEMSRESAKKSEKNLIYSVFVYSPIGRVVKVSINSEGYVLGHSYDTKIKL